MSRDVSCKTDSDGIDVMFCGGRVFHSREAATGKARSPMVERRVCSKNPGNKKRLPQLQHTGMTDSQYAHTHNNETSAIQIWHSNYTMWARGCAKLFSTCNTGILHTKPSRHHIIYTYATLIYTKYTVRCHIKHRGQLKLVHCRSENILSVN